MERSLYIVSVADSLQESIPMFPMFLSRSKLKENFWCFLTNVWLMTFSLLRIKIILV